MSLSELALMDGRKPLPLGDVIGLTLTVIRVITTTCLDICCLVLPTLWFANLKSYFKCVKKIGIIASSGVRIIF
jgi:hypothetical protein